MSYKEEVVLHFPKLTGADFMELLACKFYDGANGLETKKADDVKRLTSYGLLAILINENDDFTPGKEHECIIVNPLCDNCEQHNTIKSNYKKIILEQFGRDYRLHYV